MAIVQSLVNAPVHPEAFKERVCPVQVDSLHEDYRRVKPLLEMTPLRKTSGNAKPYHPDHSDLCMEVDIRRVEGPSKVKILFSLTTGNLINTETGLPLDKKSIEDLADRPIKNAFRLVGGHPSENRINLRELATRQDIGQSLGSIYVYLEPMDPDRKVYVDFSVTHHNPKPWIILR